MKKEKYPPEWDAETLIYANLSMEEVYRLAELFQKDGKMPESATTRGEEKRILYDKACRSIEEAIERNHLQDKFHLDHSIISGFGIRFFPRMSFNKWHHFMMYKRERELFEIKIENIIKRLDNYEEDEWSHHCQECDYHFVVTGWKEIYGEFYNKYLLCLNCGATYMHDLGLPENPADWDTAENLTPFYEKIYGANFLMAPSCALDRY